MLSLRGYKSDGQKIANYIDMSTYPTGDIDELMRIIGTLLDIRDGRINSKSNIDLAAYEPEPKSFIVLLGKANQGYRMGNAVQKGLLTSSGSFVRLAAHTVSMIVRDNKGNYIQAIAVDGHVKPLGIDHYIPELESFSFYWHDLVDNFINAAMRAAGLETRDPAFDLYHTGGYKYSAFSGLLKNFRAAAGENDFTPLEVEPFTIREVDMTAFNPPSSLK